LGPLPAPEIPHYDVWARKDGRRSIVIQPRLDCNWFQAMENSVDGPHAYILHQEFLTHRAASVGSSNTTQGFTEGIAEWRYDPAPIGIMKTRVWKDGHAESHPLIFPNMLRQGNSTQIRVPIDDEHTWHIRIEFTPTEDGREVDQADEDVLVRYDEPYKMPADALHPGTHFDMLAQVAAQDFMAWETQGPIADRSKERLGTADWGVAAFRALTKAEIAKVQEGLDPMGVTRDPDQAIIDTNLSESLKQMSRRG
jgi:5,5'-dehydrodivanillate O-demethylase